MAEKKKWAPTKMFWQWCLSYLLISVIALTLLLASGYMPVLELIFIWSIMTMMY